jgi:copper(I)-binding protein
MTAPIDRPPSDVPRRRFRRLAAALCAAAFSLAAGGASGHAYPAGTLKIEHPWSRPTAPGVSVGVGYMVIVNTGKADALVGANTPVAERVELHQTRMDGGVMKMRRAERVDIPAGVTVRLEPGGLHMMLIGLKQPLAEGAKLPLVLRFEKAGEVKVELKVETDGPSTGGGNHAHQ